MPEFAVPEVQDCQSDVWPRLDPLTQVCPTISEVTRLDPSSGHTLPMARDDRPLPTDIRVTEYGSFLDAARQSYPSQLKVVTWNMEYTANLDAQIEVLTTHADLADADVYLLNEVDRCTQRNQRQRAARRLAERVGASYAYGIEFIELDIGRQVGGDTGQAIVSRRPLSGVALTCHSSQADWFADDSQPRLGQRVFLHADVPVGDTFARVFSVHLESKDPLGGRRTRQLRELLGVAEGIQRPHVVAGDFNTWYGFAPELRTMRGAGYTDALADAGDTAPTHERGLRLDYVWARGMRVLDGGVVRGHGTSDHDPVWTVLAVE